ncbi:MAG: AmmeMemoRadiSam system protein B [Phycisphaerales bacterium]|nr:AmmeMemoRadiSam system protein B [Phycisphaerales bacterium]
MIDATEIQRPRLRPVEARPLGDGQAGKFAVHDPTGLSEAVLTVSEPALFILSLLDGRHTLDEVSAKFELRYRQPVREETLRGLIGNLDGAQLLDGPAFTAYVERLRSAYRSARVRPSVFGTRLGSTDEVRSMFDEMIPQDGWSRPAGVIVVGLITPHLDYPRGGPCYGHGYSALRGRTCPKRVVIVGTNHFGRSMSVVATAKPFETVLGETAVDAAFLDGVEARCGVSLRAEEMDHRREHSVELQLMILQHLFGAESFTIVPFLCADPCGPTGTKPLDGDGIDLREFVVALRETIRSAEGDTLVIAGADMSHVGSQFGDAFRLEPAFLSGVEERDRRALSFLETMRPDAFLVSVADGHNPTRVCSAGCMFVAASVLWDARPELLHYHQAFDEETQVCVSCAALVYTR